REYGRGLLEGELNRMICDALIELGGRTVVVISEDVSRAGLRSIPEVCWQRGSRSGSPWRG
ncbi:MAG TPA: hypothetical protein VE225_00780, partial [Rubrobacteraceae bacterium]|nr:hypothetical protein [Rubrobacteraceae bacterium]